MPSVRPIPTLIPSIVFFITFTLLSILHLKKFINLKRKIYLYLFIFGLLRTFLFAFRIAWSPNPDSIILGIISNVLLLGGFFIILEALCSLLSDWLFLLIEKRTIYRLPNFEHYSINLLKIISPVFSIIGAIGEILEQSASESQDKLVSSLREASSLGFLCLIIFYIILVSYFALKYGEDAVRKQLKALVLLISASLILIELVYRTFVSFSHEESPIYYYEWVFYVFECIPEIVLLLILGEVILGEWFYNVDDDDKINSGRQLAKLHSKGNLDASMLKGKDEIERSNVIVIKVNDEPKTSTINNTNVIDSTNSTNSSV